MTKPGLRRLHVDALDDECRGVQPAEVVETRTGTAGGRRGRFPDPATPVRVAKGSALVVGEHESVGIVLAQAHPLEVCRHHGADDLGHEHDALTGPGLWRGGDVAATDPPSQPLGPNTLRRYDNLKPAVARVLLGRSRKEPERFVALRSHYLFDAF